MATITITIPDDQLSRVVNTICLAYNYQLYFETTNDNPVLTKAQFAKLQIINFIKSTVRNQEILSQQQALKSDADTMVLS